MDLSDPVVQVLIQQRETALNALVSVTVELASVRQRLAAIEGAAPKNSEAPSP